ncbi:MAG TPA: hypothetical protein VMU49_07190 [Candidatus Acidoferrales bacterium]|nr:hypothetical protein [Candidatus Acidoferrales bacterium]
MRFIDFIRERARYYDCPVCSRNLEGCELELLSQIRDRHTIQVTCAGCQVQFQVVLVVQSEDPDRVDEPILPRSLIRGPSQLGPEANFDPNRPAGRGHQARSEARRSAAAIEPDELLDVHLRLRDWDGGVSDLFQNGSADPG